MEHNKLGKIHDWIVRIVVGIVVVLTVVSIYFTFIGCSEFDGALSKECECHVLNSESSPRVQVNSLGDTTRIFPDTIILNKKEYGLKASQNCDGLKGVAEDSLYSMHIKCSNKN